MEKSEKTIKEFTVENNWYGKQQNDQIMVQ